MSCGSSTESTDLACAVGRALTVLGRYPSILTVHFFYLSFKCTLCKCEGRGIEQATGVHKQSMSRTPAAALSLNDSPFINCPQQ